MEGLYTVIEEIQYTVIEEVFHRNVARKFDGKGRSGTFWRRYYKNPTTRSRILGDIVAKSPTTPRSGIFGSIVAKNTTTVTPSYFLGGIEFPGGMRSCECCPTAIPETESSRGDRKFQGG